MDVAAAHYLSNQEDPDDSPVGTARTSSAATRPDGPRTLGGAPAPASARSSKRSRGAAQREKRVATLGDYNKSSDDHSHGHHDSQDDDDYNDYDQDDDNDGMEDVKHKRDLFAGGEKSGLAVQNPGGDPNEKVNKIFEKARR